MATMSAALPSSPSQQSSNINQQQQMMNYSARSVNQHRTMVKNNTNNVAARRLENGRDICAYTHRVCLQNKLEGFDYCIRHILVDKSAPFRQCSFQHPQTLKRCPNAARRTSERRDSSLCPWHIKKLYLKRKQQQQQQQLSNVEANNRPCLNNLFKELEHYCPKSHEKKRLKIDWIKQDDETTTASDTLRQKINEAAANLNELSDSDADTNNPLIEDTFRSDVIDSDSESIDSDIDDPLRHASVYTAEEVSLILRDKMIKLQTLYINQFKQLQYLLREKRKKYFHALKQEKDSTINETIASSVTNMPAKAMKHYHKLKALARYHRYHGKEALLKRQVKEKRRQASLSSSSSSANANDASERKPTYSQCIYLIGGTQSCGQRCLPLSHYCKKHILYDPNQVLFRPCSSGTPPCLTPIISYTKKNSCPIHKEFKTDINEIKQAINNGDATNFTNTEPELFQTIDDIASLGLDAVTPGSLFGLDQFADLGQTDSVGLRKS